MTHGETFACQLNALCSVQKIEQAKRVPGSKQEPHPQGGYCGFQVTGMTKGVFGSESFNFRIFLGCKILVNIFFLIAWFKKGFFCTFKTIWRFMITSTYPGHVVRIINFYGSEIRHRTFWGLNFGPGIFLGFDISPHSILSVTWNPEYPLPGPPGLPTKDS